MELNNYDDAETEEDNLDTALANVTAELVDLRGVIGRCRDELRYLCNENLNVTKRESSGLRREIERKTDILEWNIDSARTWVIFSVICSALFIVSSIAMGLGPGVVTPVPEVTVTVTATPSIRIHVDTEYK